MTFWYFVILLVVVSLSNIISFEQGTRHAEYALREVLRYKCKYCAEHNKKDVPQVENRVVMGESAPVAQVIEPKV